MSHFDVFNGDADGLCALHQLRLVEPRDSVLVTGPKRDIDLVRRVQGQPGDTVTVLDISFARNRAAVLALLQQGVRMRYFDHHFADDVPVHPLLDAHLDTAPDVCTSVLVDRFLDGQQRIWAVVAAFGDNLPQTARRLATHLSLEDGIVAQLKELGECLNHNAYGINDADLVYPPAMLYRQLHGHADPLRFMEAEPVFARIKEVRDADMDKVRTLTPERETAGTTTFRLPDAAWGRRVVGSLANRLVSDQPARAHVVLVPNAQGGLMVSLRVPPRSRITADQLARRFGGGGRSIAAGINHLCCEVEQAFLEEFEKAFHAD